MWKKRWTENITKSKRRFIFHCAAKYGKRFCRCFEGLLQSFNPLTLSVSRTLNFDTQKWLGHTSRYSSQKKTPSRVGKPSFDRGHEVGCGPGVPGPSRQPQPPQPHRHLLVGGRQRREGGVRGAAQQLEADLQRPQHCTELRGGVLAGPPHWPAAYRTGGALHGVGGHLGSGHGRLVVHTPSLARWSAILHA